MEHSWVQKDLHTIGVSNQLHIWSLKRENDERVDGMGYPRVTYSDVPHPHNGLFFDLLYLPTYITLHCIALHYITLHTYINTLIH